jgi:hypothetical protein
MNFEPQFVPGGVYLKTPTGELIGRLDELGSPFESLDEAREKLDWLEMALQFQQAQAQRDIPDASRAIAAGSEYAGNGRATS